MVCKDFCPNTERKFTKTVKDKVKCLKIHFETEDYLCTETIFVKNAHARAGADDSPHVISLLSVSKI